MRVSKQSQARAVAPESPVKELLRPLLERDENRNHFLARFQRPQRLAENGAEGARGIARLHRVTGRRRGRQQITNFYRPVLRINLAVDFANQSEGEPSLRKLPPVKDQPRPVVTEQPEMTPTTFRS